MRRRTLIQLLAVRWGFAAMVGVAVVTGVVAAVTVAPPPNLPSIALGALPVYRVEVGAAVFTGLYLGATALFLAMHNRAYTELGTSGIRASALAAEEDAEFEELTLELMEEVRGIQAWRREREIGNQETT